jgi:hypothetical protein
LIGIATSIHISSLLFVFVYFLDDKKINIKFIFFLIASFFIVRVLLFPAILSILTKIISSVNQPVLVSFLERVSIYLKLKPSVIISIGFIRRLIFLILFIFMNEDKTINNIYFNIYFIGYLIYIFFMGNDVLSTRMSLSFEFFMIPLFTTGFKEFTRKNIYIICFLSLLLLLLFITILRNGNAIPYQTYLL